MPCANGGIVITDNVTKMLNLLKLASFRPHQEIAIQSIIQDQKDAVICTHMDYHNQHESAALIGLFHATSSVLTSVESYRNYQKPTQREVQGYLSSLQRRVILTWHRFEINFLQLLSIYVFSLSMKVYIAVIFYSPTNLEHQSFIM